MNISRFSVVCSLGYFVNIWLFEFLNSIKAECLGYHQEKVKYMLLERLPHNLRWRKERICSERLITICAVVKAGHARDLWSGISVRSRGDKDQSGLSYHLHNIDTCAPACTEYDFWAICWGWPVRVDRLVSYPLVFIYLWHNQERFWPLIIEFHQDTIASNWYAFWVSYLTDLL